MPVAQLTCQRRQGGHHMTRWTPLTVVGGTAILGLSGCVQTQVTRQIRSTRMRPEGHRLHRDGVGHSDGCRLQVYWIRVPEGRAERDGTAETLLVVQLRNAVHWCGPADATAPAESHKVGSSVVAEPRVGDRSGFRRGGRIAVRRLGRALDQRHEVAGQTRPRAHSALGERAERL